MSVSVNVRRQSIFLALIAVMAGMLVLASVGPVHSQSAESYYSKAVGKYIEGDYEASFNLLQKVLEEDPDNSSAKRLLPEVKQELPDSFLEKKQKQNDTKKKDAAVDTPTSDEVPGDKRPDSATDDDQTDTAAESRGVQENQPQEQQQSGTTAVQDGDTEAEVSGDTEGTGYPEFQPVDESKRDGGSLAPPELNQSPNNVVRHINENYSKVDGREEAIYGLIARDYDDRVRFEIRASGRISYIGSRIFNPPMIIVDLPNSVDRLPDSPLPVDLNKITRARHSQYRTDPIRTTRLVLDLEQWSDRYRLYRNPDGAGVVLDVFKEDADLPPETPMVHRVDSIPSATREVSSSANLEIVQGDDQSVPLNATAPKQLSLRLTDSAGEAMTGETVVYSVEKGKGTIQVDGVSGLEGNRNLTDDGGFSRATFESDTVAGVAVVEASVPSKNLSVKYRIKVKPGEARELVKVQGDRQSTLYGQSVPEPLIVEARDRYGNPVPGVELKFEDLTRKALLDIHSDSQGLQVRGTTNSAGRVVVDHYRIASDVERNRVRVQTYRRDKPLKTTFLVYGQPQLITIDFKSANLQDVLRTLAQIADWNIALTEETAGGNLSDLQVTVHLEEVTALRALDTILDVKGLSRVSDGNVMKIVSKQAAIRKGVSVISPEELSDYPANNIVTVAFKLRFLQASQELAQQLQGALLAENSSIVADQSSNSLVVTDLANNLRRLKRIITTIDRQDQLFDVRVFELDKRDPQSIQSSITELLPTGQGNVVAHRATNSLLVYADPGLMGRIENIVKSLDTKNALAENMEVINVEGYDAERLANRINTILGVQVIPVENIDFNIEDSENASDLISGAEEVDIGSIVNSAKILPLANLEKIIVFGPQNIRGAAKKLVDDLRQEPGKYLEQRTWEWVTFEVLPFEQARSLIDKMGGVQVQTELERLNSFLLSSKSKEDLERIIRFAGQVEQDFDERSRVGIYKLKHVQLATEEAVDDFEESLEEVGDEMFEEVGFVVNGIGQTITYSTDRDKMPEMRSLIASLDTSAYEHSQGQIVNYTPNYVSAGQVSRFLTNQDLGVVLAPAVPEGGQAGQGGQEAQSTKVTFIPKEDRNTVMSRLEKFDSTGMKTYSYRLKNMTSNDDNAEEMSIIASELGINVTFTNDAESNKIFFTTTPDNQEDVRSLLEAFDEPGVSDERVPLNFTPTYAAPESLVGTIDAQNLGQVIFVNQDKITLLVPENEKEKIRGMLKKIDDPSQSFEVLKLRRRQASEDLITNLQTVLNELGVNAQLAADPKTNSILYAAPQSQEDQVASVIKRLDSWQKQVLIKAVLVEISLDEEERLNPQWIANPGAARNPFVNENQFDPTDSLGLGYNLGAQGGDGNLSALLEAGDFLTVMQWIRESDRSDVVTRPAVTALNNQEASIDLSQQRFFQTTNFDDDGNVVSTTFEPQSADKTLEVTPTITKDSNIIMNVQIQNDVFGNRPGPGAPFPVNRRVTENQVMVNDGQTIVLGGFIQTNQTENEQAVPILSDFPFVGNFFKSTTESTNRSELVVFLTPYVMETPEDINEGSDEALEKMQEVERPDEMSYSQATTDEPTAGQETESAKDTVGLSIDSAEVSAQGERRNLNQVSGSDLREQVNGHFADRVTTGRKQKGYFTGWSDLQSRLNLTNNDIQTLQRAYTISVPVVNVNKASQEKLTRLPGLSSDLASNIVDYRFTNGAFRSLEGLYQVFGMDERTYRRLEPFLTVE